MWNRVQKLFSEMLRCTDSEPVSDTCTFTFLSFPLSQHTLLNPCVTLGGRISNMTALWLIWNVTLDAHSCMTGIKNGPSRTEPPSASYIPPHLGSWTKDLCLLILQLWLCWTDPLSSREDKWRLALVWL